MSMRTPMKPPRPRRDPRSLVLSTLPLTEAVETEIRELSNRVRVLLELLNVCRLADRGGQRRPSPSPSATD
jgi:hypothetical protein